MSVRVSVSSLATPLRPWVLGGMAHHDASVARHFAAAALKLYDETPSDMVSMLHSEARRMLDPARRLRQQVEALANGTPLAELSSRARRHVAKYRFVCLSERIVEAGHKDVKMRGGHRKISGSTVSMALRSSAVLERRTKSDEEELKAVLGQLNVARQMRVSSRGVGASD